MLAGTGGRGEIDAEPGRPPGALGLADVSPHCNLCFRRPVSWQPHLPG
jgi:hypothetical protein